MADTQQHLLLVDDENAFREVIAELGESAFARTKGLWRRSTDESTSAPSMC